MPKKVLIADDNDSVRGVLRWFLEKQPGVEVCALSKDGVEAIDAALRVQPDLLILDVLMPGLNGIEVASILKHKLPKAKTVLFTMFDDIVQTLAPMVGANVVLAKNKGISELMRTVLRLLSDRYERVDRILSLAARDRQMDANRLQALAGELGAPVTRCSRDLKYVWVSQEYAKWLQQPVDKIAGRSILGVVGAEAFGALRHRFDQALSGEAVTYQAQAKYEVIGSRRVFAAYRPTAGTDGTVDGWLAYVEDITDTEDDAPVGATGKSPVPEVP